MFSRSARASSQQGSAGTPCALRRLLLPCLHDQTRFHVVVDCMECPVGTFLPAGHRAPSLPSSGLLPSRLLWCNFILSALIQCRSIRHGGRCQLHAALEQQPGDELRCAGAVRQGPSLPHDAASLRLRDAHVHASGHPGCAAAAAAASARQYLPPALSASQTGHCGD